MLETPRLILRLLSEEDEHKIVAWRNSKEVINNLLSYKGITIDEHRIWYANYLQDETRIEFVICKRDNNEKIGTVGLSSIDYKNQTGEYGILLGENQERGKGYAKEASIAVINYAFLECNLRKIKLKVFCDNNRAINMYKRLGFNEEGILRAEIFKNGLFKDILMMAILKDEWLKKDV